MEPGKVALGPEGEARRPRLMVVSEAVGGTRTAERNQQRQESSVSAKDQISIYQALVLRALDTNRWLTAAEVARSAQMAPRTARAHLHKFLQLGLVDVVRLHPGYRYRLRADAADRPYAVRLRAALSVFEAWQASMSA
jgi:predicted DNA-binding transcriptional regulator